MLEETPKTPLWVLCSIDLYAGQKQQLEPGMKKWTGSKLGKEYIKAVYCHIACLTYM